MSGPNAITVNVRCLNKKQEEVWELPVEINYRMSQEELYESLEKQISQIHNVDFSRFAYHAREGYDLDKANTYYRTNPDNPDESFSIEHIVDVFASPPVITVSRWMSFEVEDPSNILPSEKNGRLSFPEGLQAADLSNCLSILMEDNDVDYNEDVFYDEGKEVLVSGSGGYIELKVILVGIENP